jgi:ketosteroid isomerase-like protein
VETDGLDAAITSGRAFVDAIVAHDWEAIARCFAPDAVFHAVVPNAKPFREQEGGDAAAQQMRRWFGDADITELVSSTVEPMHDRVHVAYRIHEHEPDGWYLVEQHAFITPARGGFAAMDLVCSGFRPVPE